MSAVPNIIVVSGNVPKSRVARGRKPRSAPLAKKRGRPSKAQSTRSDAYNAASSDVEDYISQEFGHRSEEADGRLSHEELEELEEQSLSPRSGSEEEGSEDVLEEPGDIHTNGTKPKKSRAKRATGPPPMETFINQTAFDVYFAYASSKLRISSNVLSSLVEPLSNEEIQGADRAARTRAINDHDISRLCKSHEEYFPHYWVELHSGFNLLFHGYGSKKETLIQFARDYCSRHGHVVVINGYNKRTNLKAIISAIEQIPELSEQPLPGSGWENQLWRVYDFFRGNSNAHLYLLIHNIEAMPLRDPKTRVFLSTLALHTRVHILASVDHINSSLLWSSSEIFTRKHPETEPGSPVPSTRGYAWLFHDLTTFKPYVDEMRSRDVGSLPSQAQASTAGIALGQAMTEPAMLHILASVTDKAKRLFRLLASRQVVAIDEETGNKPVGMAGMEKYGMQYELLFNEARKDFLATSDIALRALLGEFMDHDMIKAGGQPEVLWIPAGKEVIKRVLQGLDS